MDQYQETRFQRQLDAALQRIKTILENTRSPKNPEDVGHSYSDKYFLVEFLTNSALASLIESWQYIGLSKENVQKMKTWSQERSVTLRFCFEHRCAFSRKKERKVESSTQYVTKVKGLFSATDKVVTTVTDYFWNIEADYSLFAFQGTDVDDFVPLISRKGAHEICTSSDNTPVPAVVVSDPIDLNITWMLQQLNNDLDLGFSINRNKESCHTPRRNEETDFSFRFFQDYYRWADRIASYFRNTLFNIQKHELDLSMINDVGLFVPVVPLFEPTLDGEPRNLSKIVAGSLVSVRAYQNADEDEDKTSALLGGDELDLFLQEQKQSIDYKIEGLNKVFPVDKELITKQEAILVTLLIHHMSICQHYGDGIQSVEEMLRKQLVAAIGKEVTADDFAEYMQFHFRKLFKAEFVPKLFCYAVRRPDHYPEGVVSIEADIGSGNEAICSMVKCMEPSGHIMKFPINSATNISFGGERYVHTWVSHKFSGSLEAKLKIIARARQFSSFILMIGNVTGPNDFQPKEAIIIQNKDDLLIPLLTEVIPTPKAFKKAVESLSETQRNFATAFRSMQLESTLFGLCIIQIKPQLEKVLNLPEDSLTKEIRLTQNLMELFIEYQISSDLISFEGEDGVGYTQAQKLSQVKQNVAAMRHMISQAKQKEIDDAKMKAVFDSPLAPPSPVIQQSNFNYLSAPCDLLESNSGSYSYSECDGYGGIEPVCGYDDCGFMDESDDFGDCDFMDEAQIDLLSSPVSSNLNQIESSSPPVSFNEQLPTDEAESNKTENADEMESKQEEKEKEFMIEKVSGSSLVDFTKLPGILNKNFDLLDTDSALHATILKTGDVWTKKFQQNLLASPEETTLGDSAQEKERNKTFDLLDALSRSGALVIDAASFHVVVAVTHCFDRTLLDSIVKDNINPIEKVERSALIVSSTIHEQAPEDMIKDEHLQRLKSGPSSHLF